MVIRFIKYIISKLVLDIIENIRDDNHYIISFSKKKYYIKGNYKYIRVEPQQTSNKRPKYLTAVFTFDSQGNMVTCRSEFLCAPMKLDFSSLIESNKKALAADSNSP